MAIANFQSAFLDVQAQDQTVIATVTRPALSEEENIDVLGKDLNDLVEQYGCHSLVVSLENVTYITSAALGKLITLHRRLHRKAGRLIVCGALTSVQEVLKATGLNAYFTLAADIPSAMSLISVE